jgi:hypothetical protein
MGKSIGISDYKIDKRNVNSKVYVPVISGGNVDSIGNWARGYLFLIFRKKKFVDVLRL